MFDVKVTCYNNFEWKALAVRRRTNTSISYIGKTYKQVFWFVSTLRTLRWNILLKYAQLGSFAVGFFFYLSYLCVTRTGQNKLNLGIYFGKLLMLVLKKNYFQFTRVKITEPLRHFETGFFFLMFRKKYKISAATFLLRFPHRCLRTSILLYFHIQSQDRSGLNFFFQTV